MPRWRFRGGVGGRRGERRAGDTGEDGGRYEHKGGEGGKGTRLSFRVLVGHRKKTTTNNRLMTTTTYDHDRGRGSWTVNHEHRL